MSDSERRRLIELIEQPLRVNVRHRDGTFQFHEVRAPSPAVYEKFVRELVSLSNGLREGKDPLQISVVALRALVEYVQGDGTTFAADVFKPFIVLLEAAHDTENGSRKTIFHVRPETKGGRPSDLEMHRGRAYIVMALDALIASGLSVAEATQIVVDEFKQVNAINPKTKKPYTTQVLNQLHKKTHDGTGPGKQIEYYNELTKPDVIAEIWKSARTNEARVFARVLVMSITKHT